MLMSCIPPWQMSQALLSAVASLLLHCMYHELTCPLTCRLTRRPSILSTSTTSNYPIRYKSLPNRILTKPVRDCACHRISQTVSTTTTLTWGTPPPTHWGLADRLPVHMLPLVITQRCVRNMHSYWLTLPNLVST